MELLKEIGLFLLAVVSGWAGYATGGIIVATVAFWHMLRNSPVSRKLGIVLAAVFLLMAFFKAWQEQYERATKSVTVNPVQINNEVKVPPAQVVIEHQNDTHQRSYLSFVGNPSFPQDIINGVNQPPRDFRIGDKFHFNYTTNALGPNPIEVLNGAQLFLFEPDATDASQENAIKRVQAKMRESNKLNAKKSGSTRMPEHTSFNTVFATDDKDNEMMVTQGDLDEMRDGKKIAFTLTEISYRDRGALHHLRRCVFLQPPATVQIQIWHFCDGFNNSD